ncbi:MAG: selenide, water dikinase SelD [Pseudomonadota bacterium]
MKDLICLTEYSHGAGCGCKIAPNVLDSLLHSQLESFHAPRLIVGNASRDDAAVYDLGDGRGVISTTDFFMPIVDDPFDFGRIAATNAISDVYAMGGRPLMAIAIFGWPIDKLEPEVGRQVIDGGRAACHAAGIPLAGGHSIDAPEPIFGLAVTGEVALHNLKRNDTARAGARLYLTKPIGIGLLTTAQKGKKLRAEHAHIARDWMVTLNTFGASVSDMDKVVAMTDVTGFGLLGHLLEMCEGSGVNARIRLADVPVIPEAREYAAMGCSPGGTHRNYASYGHKSAPISDEIKLIVCDPQTSGGLLVAVMPEGEEEFLRRADAAGLALTSFGELLPRYADGPYVEIV